MTSMEGQDSISIAQSLARSPDKLYCGTTDIDGFEWGFGRAGWYPAHAHKVFFDVLFAPGGMDLRVGECQINDCRLFVAAPGCFYDTLSISDFWFIKFVGLASAPRPELPEKVMEESRSPQGLQFFALASGIARIAFSHWSGQHEGQITFAVREEKNAWTLYADLTSGRSFVVRP